MIASSFPEIYLVRQLLGQQKHRYLSNLT